jgi:hypothetical protein
LCCLKNISFSFLYDFNIRFHKIIGRQTMMFPKKCLFRILNTFSSPYVISNTLFLKSCIFGSLFKICCWKMMKQKYLSEKKPHDVTPFDWSETNLQVFRKLIFHFKNFYLQNFKKLKTSNACFNGIWNLKLWLQMYPAITNNDCLIQMAYKSV